MEIVLLVAAVAALIGFAVRRGSELFVLSIRDGRVMVLRGALPGRLLHDLQDVIAASPPVAHGSVRATFGRGSPALDITGAIDDSRAQRLRNVFHIMPEAKLRNAMPPSNRNWGQRLGIPALAWYLRSR